MKIDIDINIRSFNDDISLPLSFKRSLELKITPVIHQIEVGVSNFPYFTTVALNDNMGVLKDFIGLNILSQRLVMHTDPLEIESMDSITLSQLNIGQNKTIYSI